MQLHPRLGPTSQSRTPSHPGRGPTLKRGKGIPISLPRFMRRSGRRSSRLRRRLHLLTDEILQLAAQPLDLADLLLNPLK